jgi:hypothetical protein
MLPEKAVMNIYILIRKWEEKVTNRVKGSSDRMRGASGRWIVYSLPDFSKNARGNFVVLWFLTRFLFFTYYITGWVTEYWINPPSPSPPHADSPPNWPS